MIAPWIVPSNSYSYSPETNNPYSRGASEQVEKPRQQPGYGLSERQSEIDLYNLPDAFASTSSLDLLGTLAEMKLPSAKSLENLQKYGMEGGPSTASLSEWYSVLADSNPSYNSMNDMTSPRNDSQHRLMPWDLKGSQEAISNTQKSANSPHQIKHSLSRELLQAAADAEARDEAKSELEKILRAQQIEKLKQEKNVSTQPVVPDVKMSAIDARRSSSIDNFMSVL